MDFSDGVLGVEGLNMASLCALTKGIMYIGF